MASVDSHLDASQAPCSRHPAFFTHVAAAAADNDDAFISLQTEQTRHHSVGRSQYTFLKTNPTSAHAQFLNDLSRVCLGSIWTEKARHAWSKKELQGVKLGCWANL